MAVMRAKDITIMSSYHLKDMNISLKAKGLLSQMLTLPDDWECSLDALCHINKENRYAIKSALNELIKYGYLAIEKIYPDKTENGRIEYVYEIFEQPQKGDEIVNEH